MKQVMMVGVLADMLASTASPFASQSNIFSLQSSPMTSHRSICPDYRRKTAKPQQHKTFC